MVFLYYISIRTCRGQTRVFPVMSSFSYIGNFHKSALNVASPDKVKGKSIMMTI